MGGLCELGWRERGLEGESDGGTERWRERGMAVCPEPQQESRKTRKTQDQPLYATDHHHSHRAINATDAAAMTDVPLQRGL